jgi:hypothetical protein
MRIDIGNFIPSLRAVRWAMVALVLAWLAGCANTAAKRTAGGGLELDLNLEPGQGLVVLKVVSLRPISLLNPKWQSVEIESQGRRQEMLDVTPPNTAFTTTFVNTESLYFAKLRAGDYEVTGMGSNGPGPGLLMAALMSDHATVKQRLPRFTVEAGRLANLGTVIFSPEVEKLMPERLVLLSGPAGKLAAQKALRAEARRPDLPLSEGGGWAVPAESVASEVGEVAQARPLATVLSLRMTDRGLVGGSHLGQIFRRTGADRWERETIDTLGPVLAVGYTVDGRLLAGSHYGEYFVKASDGRWERHRLGSETGNVVHVEGRPGGGGLFVISDAAGSRILTKKAIDDPAEVPVDVVKFAGATGHLTPPQLLSTSRELILISNTPGLSRELTLTRVDKQTLAATASTEKFWIMDWQMLPSGDVAVTRMNGISTYPSKWVDQQRRWVHSEESGSRFVYWIDERNGLDLETSIGMVNVTNYLRATSDGGKTWKRIGTPIETRHFAGRIVYADANEVLLYGYHVVYTSTDRGQTWRPVKLPAN